MPETPASLRALLTGLIDYAGLFPPAGLAMLPAVRNYADYRQGTDAWALGRFIVPGSRLEEFEGAAAALLPTGADEMPWPVSMLGGAEPGQDAEQIFNFNERHAAFAAGRAAIDTLEVKAADSATITRLVRSAPDHVRVFVEIPVDGDTTPLLEAIRANGANAKIRTGGITADAFPSAEDVARFLIAAARAGVPFKATAGLHHARTAEYRLTYEPGSAEAPMFGFLNIFMAAAFARQGADQPTLVRLLKDGESTAFRFTRIAGVWRDPRVSAEEITAMRASFGLSFGSCSFTEPMDDLRHLRHL